MKQQQKPEVWILEDAPEVRDLLVDTFEGRYDLKVFNSLKQFFQVYKENEEERPDLLIADLQLSDGNFLNFLESDAWKSFPIRPFFVLSGETDLERMRACYHAGASDFITKPFPTSSISLKVERMLNGRRNAAEANQEKKDFPVLHSFDRKVTFRGQTSEALTIREFEILKVLSLSFENAVHRDDIIQHVWDQKKVSPKSFDVHLCSLRRKLSAIGLQIFLASSSAYALSKRSA